MSTSQRKMTGLNERYPASRTPGPLGRFDAADPNVSMCLAGDTPGALGTHEDLASPELFQTKLPQTNVPLLLFDLDRVAHFLRSVGVAMAEEAFTRVEWKDFDESVLLNVLMFWNKPGMAVVVQGKPVDIKARADEHVDRMLSTFIRKCAEGPGSALEYLDRLKGVRADALNHIQKTIGQASEINDGVIQLASYWIRYFSTVKTGADLFMIGAGLVSGLGFITPFVTGVTYSVVKDWAKGSEAKGVGLVVATEVGKEAAKEGVKAGSTVAAGVAIPPALQGIDRWDAEARILEKQDLINTAQQDVLTKGRRKTKILNRRIGAHTAEIDRLKTATSPLRQGVSKGFHAVARNIKFVFAAKDAYESIAELVEVIEQTKEE
ncbi:hypothetical protein [Tautonia rosea]|uniref:hypothetical protein n=1 Tax=Tautonia rosea TaxID=2728037 RepID=UPI001474A744|nr:hypothetical protein [Tautonia rosea]